MTSRVARQATLRMGQRIGIGNILAIYMRSWAININLKWSRRAAKRSEQSYETGAAYVMLLLAVLTMGIGLVALSEVWYTTLRREKEQELLFIGNQFRQAIGQYCAADSTRCYPKSLEDLLKDPRFPGTKRYLRKIFADPMTGDRKWGLIKNPSGGIMGVHSLSNQEPIKKFNFKLTDRSFEGKNQYSEWVFIHGSYQK